MNTFKWLLFLAVTIFGILVVLFFAPKSEKASPSNTESPKGEKVIKTYYDDGNLKTSVTYVDNQKHGIACNYYPSGKIHTQFNYKKGLKEGEAIWFYENGIPFQKTMYVDNLRQGIQFRYHESGELMAEIPFKNDTLQIGTKEYFKNGEPITLYPDFKITKLNEESLKVTVRIDGLVSKNIKGVYAAITYGNGKRIIQGNQKEGKFYLEIPRVSGNSSNEVQVFLTLKTKLNNQKLFSKNFIL